MIKNGLMKIERDQKKKLNCLIGQLNIIKVVIFMRTLMVQNGDSENGQNGQGHTGNDRDGVIDYTPLKKVSNVWASSEEEGNDSHQEVDHSDSNNRGDVIDYTPYEEKDVDWDSLLQRKQLKTHQSHHKLKKSINK